MDEAMNQFAVLSWTGQLSATTGEEYKYVTADRQRDLLTRCHTVRLSHVPASVNLKDQSATSVRRTRHEKKTCDTTWRAQCTVVPSVVPVSVGGSGPGPGSGIVLALRAAVFVFAVSTVAV